MPMQLSKQRVESQSLSVEPRPIASPRVRSRDSATDVLPNKQLALQRKPCCACGGACPRCQAWRSSNAEAREQDPAKTARSRSTNVLAASSGELLDSATRAFMESRFDRDFSEVRLHSDASAAHSARAIDARAYTAGSHIAFGDGQFAPTTLAGQRLLAHELTHVVQQSGNAAAMDTLAVAPSDSPLEREADQVSAAVIAGRSATVSGVGTVGARQVQRQGYGDVRVAEHRDEVRARLVLDYKKAEKGNKANAKNGPAWEHKLATAAGGKYKAWNDFWAGGKYDAFADQVASFQIDLGLPEKSIDGILGAQTWARLAGLGEAMAGIEEVTWPKSETTCTVASEERIKRGYKLATGRTFELPEDKNASDFNVILQSINGRLLDVPEEYRGTGAAGALVYAGMGKFVSESDIWAGKLEPGAAIQVWGNRKDFDLMHAGRIKENGKWRRINDSDASFSGTSFVFIRYDTDTNERMLVRHFGGSEWKSKSWYEKWVAANPVTPDAQLPAP